MTDKLFSPITIGPHQLKNRIVMPAMHLGMCDDGRVGQAERRFYSERARANVSLIMAGLCNTFADTSATITGVLELSSDKHIDGMATLHQDIATVGALSAVQLSPIAGYNNPAWKPDESHLTMLIESIGIAARRAQIAGFHYVELMLSGGSLLSHLLSPHHNPGTLPNFSGSFENRLRGPLNAMRAIQRHAPDMPIIIRMHGHEYLPGGYGLADAARIAARLADEGAVAINVTVAGHRTKVPQITRQRSAESFGFLGRNIKDAVGIPVFYGSRIRNYADAVAVMRASGADCITVGRALIADPLFAQKIEREFRKHQNTPPLQDDNEIINCIGCCQCLDQAFAQKPAHCTVNPAIKLGIQSGFTQTQYGIAGNLNAIPNGAANRLRVVVAGSGPAGLHAALDYVQKGASVTLVEKEKALGGKWRRISQLSSHDITHGALTGTIAAVQNAPIEIMKNTELTPRLVATLSPDILVLATGAAPRRIDLKGIETHPCVFHVSELVDTDLWPEFKHAVIIGGNAAGVTMALHLATPGFATTEAIGYLHRFGSIEWAEEALSFKPAKSITILKRRGFFGKGMGRATRWTAVQEMDLFGVNTIDKVQYEEVTPEGLWIRQGKQSERRFIKADLLILSTGFQPILDAAEFEGLVPKIVVKGDAHRIGNITDAINGVYTSL
ncbi:MAG: FAD-dependent oxidoreductase [Deltaproteobacteria bacterium]|nr:FAD-dependent oxidoreductase [Deltaproteobacteria bacterium]